VREAEIRVMRVNGQVKTNKRNEGTQLCTVKLTLSCKVEGICIVYEYITVVSAEVYNSQKCMRSTHSSLLCIRY
jgi:hypothetical protein